MESVVDFSSREEVPITFEYERIANYCSICKMLTHSSRDGIRKIPPPPERELNEFVGRRYSSQIENPPSFYQKVPQGEVYPHEEKESFHCRVDRHGTPFGNRVSSDNSRVQPLKNKITPGNPSLSPLARTQDAHHAVAHGRGSVPNRYKPPNPPQL